MDPHCLPACKNRFEIFARIFNRRHKQTIFSDACFLGVLRVKYERISILMLIIPFICPFFFLSNK